MRQETLAAGEATIAVPTDKPGCMTASEDGSRITRTMIRCGLEGGTPLATHRVLYVPGRRGAVLELKAEDGSAIVLDLDTHQVGDLVRDLGLSQRQAWENDRFPDDLLREESTAPPKWMGPIPSRKLNKARGIRRGK